MSSTRFFPTIVFPALSESGEAQESIHGAGIKRAMRMGRLRSPQRCIGMATLAASAAAREEIVHPIPNAEAAEASLRRFRFLTDQCAEPEAVPPGRHAPLPLGGPQASSVTDPPVSVPAMATGIREVSVMFPCRSTATTCTG